MENRRSIRDAEAGGGGRVVGATSPKLGSFGTVPQLWNVDFVHFYFCLFLHVNLGPSPKIVGQIRDVFSFGKDSLDPGRCVPPPNFKVVPTSLRSIASGCARLAENVTCPFPCEILDTSLHSLVVCDAKWRLVPGRAGECSQRRLLSENTSRYWLQRRSLWTFFAGLGKDK